MIIEITTILFVVASMFVTHFAIIENYNDKLDVVISYFTSIVMFSLLGLCVGYLIDSF